jgi:hypothetical protein
MYYICNTKHITMKTKLPAALTTVEEIESFISELSANDEFFHLDDDPHDIITMPTGERLFTDEEADKVNDLLEQAFNICEVWELPVVCNIVDAGCNELNAE